MYMINAPGRCAFLCGQLMWITNAFISSMQCFSCWRRGETNILQHILPIFGICICYCIKNGFRDTRSLRNAGMYNVYYEKMLHNIYISSLKSSVMCSDVVAHCFW